MKNYVSVMNMVTFKVKTHKAYIKSMLNSSLQNTRKRQGKNIHTYSYSIYVLFIKIFKNYSWKEPN